MAEYDGSTGQQRYTYIYAGDQRIAIRNSQNKLHYYLNDHLGSARVVIDSTGTVMDKSYYMSFGLAGQGMSWVVRGVRIPVEPHDALIIVNTKENINALMKR